MQRPPAFSAIHVNGKRAYELARKESESLSVKVEDGSKESGTTEITNPAHTTESAESAESATLANAPQREASFDIPARPVAIESVTYTPTLPSSNYP